MLATRIKNEIHMRLFNAGVTRAASKHRQLHDYGAIDHVIARYRAGGGLTNAIQPYKLWSLQELLERYAPRSIIEFGSGLSTVMFGQYAKKHEARVLSIDENMRWIENTRGLLSPGSPVELRQAERIFESHGAHKIMRYDFESSEIFDLALVDGPSSVVEGVKHLDAVNVDVLRLPKLPDIILVDVRKSTARYLAEKTKETHDAFLSDLFWHRQYFDSDYQYFSVLMKK